MSEGTILTSTTGVVTLDPTTRLGSAALDLSAAIVNFGTPPADAPAGLTFAQETLQALLAGDPAAGVPALRQLTLSASDSVNFYGTFDLNTLDPKTRQSTLQSFQLNTPAIYGAPGVNASLTTGAFIWNGVLASNGTSSLAPGLWTRGGGSGSATLSVTADTIVFGYGAADLAQDQTELGRLIVGFDTVDLTANQSLAGNNKGALSVYRTATQSSSGALQSGSGGDLTLTTPLLTGAPGSVLTITAGGNMTVAAPATSQPVGSVNAQGASLTLNAATIGADTAIVLPSGQLILNATAGAVSLGSQSQLDLAGVATTLNDETTYGWGGSVTIQAANGGITQDAAGTIDVSAANANAGSVSLIAPGVVTMAGALKGSAAAGFNSGSFSVRAGGFGAADPDTGFTALNTALDTGGFFGARTFELLAGDLTIGAGTTVTAHTVSVAVDQGALTVAGTVNASGAAAGTIRLSAGTDLTLAAGAVLDAHGTVSQVDSNGQSIDSENTASVTLTAVNGTLTIAPASDPLPAPVINVAAADGVSCALGACGQVTLNASRTGETSGGVAISAASPVTIEGAGSVVVNAFWHYAPTDPAGTVVQDNTAAGTPAGAVGLAQIDLGSQAFMAAAVGATGQLNPALATQLAGLTTDSLLPVFHLRPGVEIDSATQAGGLTVASDLDLSGMRYQSVAAPGRTAGPTEPGALVIRAGDGLTILGNINDGFTGAPALCQTAATCSNPYTYYELAQPMAPNPDGSPALSWSIRLVAGADLAAADSRTVLPTDVLASAAPVAVPGTKATQDPAGSIELSDAHLQPYNELVPGASAVQLPGWSVIRTGTGDLDLLAGGSVDEHSTYAIYTAGASPQLPADSDFNLPRGTGTPVPEVTSAGTVTFARTTNLSTTIGAPGSSVAVTALTDPAGDVFNVTESVTVTAAGTFLFGTNTKVTGGIPLVLVKSVGPIDDEVGTSLTLPRNLLRATGLTANFSSSPVVSLVNTVLGPNGQASNNGTTLESLVGGYNAWYPSGGGNLLISAGGQHHRVSAHHQSRVERGSAPGRGRQLVMAPG